MNDLSLCLDFFLILLTITYIFKLLLVDAFEERAHEALSSQECGQTSGKCIRDFHISISKPSLSGQVVLTR